MSEVGGLSMGPFDAEPVELGRVLSEHFSPSVSGDEIHRRSEAWLVDVLRRCGVALGRADREIVHMLANEGWSSVQIVAGWIGRANRRPTTPLQSPSLGEQGESPSPPPAEEPEGQGAS